MGMNPADLPDILDKHMNMLNQQSGRSPEDIQAQIFNSGHFKAAKDRQSVWAAKAEPAPFETQLSGVEEQTFQNWKAVHAPKDSGMDYDLRGAFKAGLKPGPDGHWPDTYKKPNHPTFSDESIYSSLAGTKPGRWVGDKFISFGK